MTTLPPHSRKGSPERRKARNQSSRQFSPDCRHALNFGTGHQLLILRGRVGLSFTGTHFAELQLLLFKTGKPLAACLGVVFETIVGRFGAAVGPLGSTRASR